MNRADLQEALVRALREVQSDSLLSCPEISTDTVPLRDLEGFDSYSGVEVEVRLSDVLGVEITELPFRSPKNGRLLSLREILPDLESRLGARVTHD